MSCAVSSANKKRALIPNFKILLYEQVLKDPKNEKFRTLRKANAVVQAGCVCRALPNPKTRDPKPSSEASS